MPISLTILGSNAAVPAHQRHQTAQYLSIMNQNFLVDCGEGTQMQLKKYFLKANRLNHIVISHLHGDHYYGLMGIISSMHLYGRNKDLNIFGPPGLMEIISMHLKYSETTLNYKINLHEWTPNKVELIWENDYITIHTIPLDHRVACSGYLFREKPKKRRIDKKRLNKELTQLQIIALKNGEDLVDNDNIVVKNEDMTLDPHPSFSYAYCSDTRYNERIIDQIKDVDLLYHEATFMNDFQDRASKTYHSTTMDAAKIAKAANAKKLLIGHFSTRYKELQPMIVETREVFPNAELAIEGKNFELSSD